MCTFSSIEKKKKTKKTPGMFKKKKTHVYIKTYNKWGLNFYNNSFFQIFIDS